MCNHTRPAIASEIGQRDLRAAHAAVARLGGSLEAGEYTQRRTRSERIDVLPKVREFGDRCGP